MQNFITSSVPVVIFLLKQNYWNTKWRQSGLFSDVFVPPVANDSGSAIGTAIDAQLHFTGDAKAEWDVYCGLPFS